MFRYCKIGGESEAISRYRKELSQVMAEWRRHRVSDDYNSKFEAACEHFKINESVATLAVSYLERTLQSGWLKGREIRIVAWSAFCLAAKVQRQGLTPGEVMRYSNITRQLLLRDLKELNEFLDLEAHQAQHVDPSDFLNRIVERMELKEKPEWPRSRADELVQETKNFLSTLPKQVIFGKRPEGIAAASLYVIASRFVIPEFTQGRIAVAADVTEVTVRNSLRAIEKVRPEIKKKNTVAMQDLGSD